MSILEAFIVNGTHYDVNIVWEEEDEPLFRATDIGKILGLTQIRRTIIEFGNKYKVEKSIPTPGGAQEATFLTELGLYKILMISRKPIAETFQDWVANVIKTIRKTGKYELELMKENMDNMEKSFKEKIEVALKHEARKIRMVEYKAKHDYLLDQYRNKPIVYFAYVTLPYEEENNENNEDNEENEDIKEIKEIKKFNIKIGSTKDIGSRTKTHLENFENFYLFNVVESAMNEPFEHFLHQHAKIKSFKNKDFTYVEKSSGTVRRSHEIFTVDFKTCKTIVEIAKRNLVKFSIEPISEHLIEQSNLRFEEMETKRRIAEIEYNTIQVQKALVEHETKKLINVSTSKPVKYAIDLGEDARRVTVNRGNKIQIYDPATQKLVHTFNCLMACTRDNEFFHSCSKPMIKRSIETHQVYKGYVWMDLDRDKADDFVQPFPTDTVHHTKTIKIGYLAMLSLDKTKIVNVYPDHKSATLDRNLKSSAAISKALTKGTQSRGHYFQMWDDCDPELKREYLENHQLPEKAKRVNGIVIQQVMPVTHEVVKTFVCVEDVLRDFQMSRDTLNKAIDGGYVWKGYRWLKA
jgi:prophage antirepressor-like protein